MSTKFIFVETSGHTRAATLGFLGIYQEEQEAIYEQIMEVVGDGRDPVNYLLDNSKCNHTLTFVLVEL